MKFEFSVHSSVGVRFVKDLSLLNFPEVMDKATLMIKPYSKSFYGRYFLKDNRIVVYLYRDKDKPTPYNYKELFKTLIHECCHHIQYTGENYIRRKGIMHDSDFWRLYNHYIDEAIEKGILKDGHRIQGVRAVRRVKVFKSA